MAGVGNGGGGGGRGGGGVAGVDPLFETERKKGAAPQSRVRARSLARPLALAPNNEVCIAPSTSTRLPSNYFEQDPI